MMPALSGEGMGKARKSTEMNHDIDIVIPWVDDADPAWRRDKETWYQKLNPDKSANSHTRYQNWDNLKYWFRAVEKFLPWFHKIYFLTYGHVPEFLRTDNSRLCVVRHEEFIPAEFLPTFQVCAIEMNLHRIPELSENILYFNDDSFLLDHVGEDYYFQNDTVCDEAIETPIIPMLSGNIAKYTWNMRALDVSVINRHFSKRTVQKENRDKWFLEASYGELTERNRSLDYWDHFVGFRDPHLPSALKKATFEKLWKAEPEILRETCRTKFRNFSCVNYWLARYWQLCEGDFIPRRTLGKSYVVTVQNYKEIAAVIRTQTQPVICLNEDCSPEEFVLIKDEINSALGSLLPHKSSFEK